MAARHSHDLRPFAHSHAFGDAAAPSRERALWWVTVITLATMVLELAVGYWSGSLALVADGWHMGTHALALGGAALAAALARRAHGSARFAFGGWKIEVLAAYSSGLLLLAVSAWIAIDALLALMGPRPIAYQQAIAVAVAGLVVNAVCAWVLSQGGAAGHDRGHDHAHDHRHDDGHGHSHDHSPRHGGHDHNFRAAYLHVLADALTSVLAIGALAGGLWLGVRWLDPVVAMLGGALIAHWALGVLRDSARALVDASALDPLRDAVRTTLESDGDARVADLHVWQVGPEAFTAVVSVVADRPLDAAAYRQRLAGLHALRHVTIEVHRCHGAGADDTPAARSR
ncbi:MAG: CDF family Co(II)/Ni(II) efflux transporter DmeF [Burkholderiaceae bacterium]